MGRKKVYFFNTVLLLLCLLCSLSANEFKQIKLNETTYLLDSTTINIGTERKIKEHDAKIDNIHKAYSSLYSKNDLAKKTAITDSVQVRYNNKLHTMNYRKLNNYGIFNLDIDTNNIANSIDFVTPRPRYLTEEEKRSSINNKIPASYRLFSEITAIDHARVLLESVYGQEANYFDSVKVTEYETEYILEFYIKIKNDIADSRRATIVINANTGYIEKFIGESKRDPDINYNYVPKISKQQVLEMYNNECKVLKADIVINKVYLSIYENYGKRRWTWFIYGTRRDKNLLLSAHMFVDSETGEIIVKGMD